MMNGKILIIGGVVVLICLIGSILLWQKISEPTQLPAQPTQELKLSDFPEAFKEKTVIVLGDNASEIERQAAEEIKNFLVEHNSSYIKIIDSQKIESFKKGYNLVIIGTPKTNPLLEEVYAMTNATRVTEEFPGEGKGVLEILRNPWSEEKAMLLVEGSDEWGVKAIAESISGMNRNIRDKIFVTDWTTVSSEVIVEIPQSIKLKALEVFSSSDSKISIPKDLYIDSYPSETKGYYIVQFKGPIYEEYKTQVIDLGGELLDYIPKNAFIVRMNESTRDKVQKLSVVQWIGIYQPAYKISPNLLKKLNKTGNVNLTVLVFNGEDILSISYKIEAAGGVILTSTQNKVRVLIDVSKLSKIANIKGVKYIEEYIPPQLLPKERLLEGETNE